MTAFPYTREWVGEGEDFDSSFVWAVYHNANENKAAVTLEGGTYIYSNVVAGDVEALVKADSVGSYYNTTFKPAFGPSTGPLTWYDFDEYPVEIEGDKAEATKEFSLGADGTGVSAHINGDGSVTGTVEDESTTEYSLAPIAEKVEEVTNGRGFTVRVHFTLAGVEGNKFKFDTVNATTVDEAIAELNEYIKRVGLKGSVTKVVFKFE